ncbi:MAG: cofactor assembly of complex C subunit B [Cyanobacteria bacterium J06621_8]
MGKSEPNRILRRLPFFAGGLGGLLLLINRLLTSQVSASQARSDALGVIEGAVLILVGLLWQEIQARTPETVDLVGEAGLHFSPKLSPTAKTELAWASHLLLTNTVTRSLVVYYDGKTILRRGVLGKNSQVNPKTILNRVLNKCKPAYLVNLKFYPGRVEFDYLPENVQGIICQPIGNRGALILGANAPRSYTKKDEQWIEGIADKLAVTLAEES